MASIIATSFICIFMVDCRNIKLPSIKCLTPSKQLTANWQHQLQQQPTSLCIVIKTEGNGDNKKHERPSQPSWHRNPNKNKEQTPPPLPSLSQSYGMG